MKNESAKVATIRYVVSSRIHHCEPCYAIDLSTLPGQSTDILTYSQMVSDARSLIVDGWQIRYGD